MTGVRAAGLVALATMAACVDHDELALCPAFVEYVIVYDTLEATDPSGATAGAAAEAIDGVIGEVRQLRSVAGQRYRTPIDRLEDVLDWMDETGSNGMRFQTDLGRGERSASASMPPSLHRAYQS